MNSLLKILCVLVCFTLVFASCTKFEPLKPILDDQVSISDSDLKDGESSNNSNNENNTDSEITDSEDDDDHDKENNSN